MAYKIKRTTIIVSAFVILSAGAFGTYQYKDSINDSITPSLSKIVEKVTPGYTSEYTMEEMTDKIFSHQQKSVKKLKEAYEEQLTLVKDVRITGNMNMSLDMNSSFGGGNGKMNLSGFDLQYQEDNIDMSFNEVSLGGKLEAMGTKFESSGLFKNMHLMKNELSSYMKIENSFVEGDMLAGDFLMTLNQLGKQGKYISFSENPLYEAFEESLNNQTDDSEVQFFFDIMENEKIFVVNKQEDTKYHLVPSKAFCKIMKSERVKTEVESDITEKDTIISSQRELANSAFQFHSDTMLSSAPEKVTYELFKDNYVECDEQEYSEFVENFMKSENHEVKQFYIEYSKTKTHYFFDMSIMENIDSNKTVINMGSDLIISLGSIDQSTTYLNIEDDAVTGSGIILKTNKDTFDMLFDIDMPEYELDTNMSLSGSTDSYNMIGDYSLAVPESDNNYSYNPYSGVEFSGNMKGALNEGITTFTMQNTFNEAKNGISGKLSIDSNSKLVDNNNTGDMVFAGELTLGDGASPVSGDLTAKWDTTTSEKGAKGDIKYELDIPNIATGEYILNYDIDISDTVETDFKSPENIISEQDLEKMLKKNKIIADKKRVLEVQKKIEDLKNGKNSFGAYEIDAMNSKVTSDLRNLVSALETKRVREATGLKDFIKDPKVIKRNTAYTIYSGAIDFTVLAQNGADFLSPFSGEGYELRVIEFKEEGKGSMYEIGGDRFEEETLNIYSIGNYYIADITDINSMPKKLFDIEIK